MSELTPSLAVSPLCGVIVRVQESDLDVWGHMNNVSYVQKMQDVAVEHSAVLGWDAQRYLDRGAIWVVQSHVINYKRSAYLGDVILLQTWVEQMKKVSCVRKYRFLRLPKEATEDEIKRAAGFASADDFEYPKEALLAEGETHWAFISTETLRPVRVFPELFVVFEGRRGETAKFPGM